MIGIESEVPVPGPDISPPSAFCATAPRPKSKPVLLFTFCTLYKTPLYIKNSFSTYPLSLTNCVDPDVVNLPFLSPSV